MTGRSEIAMLWLVPVLMMSPAPTVGAQRPAAPPPSGNHIVARDGDVVVVENDASVGIVRRRESSVRVVFNADERWLLLLVDHATSARPADGRVTRRITTEGSTARGRSARDGKVARQSMSTQPSEKAAREVWEFSRRMVWCSCLQGSRTSAIEVPWLFFDTRAAAAAAPTTLASMRRSTR
jgi:hypothetical protein